jgi:hypothetical protein
MPTFQQPIYTNVSTVGVRLYYVPSISLPRLTFT